MLLPPWELNTQETHIFIAERLNKENSVEICERDVIQFL